MLLVQGDERMVKLSPAQIRQRREAARARDHGQGYAAGHTPSALRRRRAARIAGVGALVAVGVPVYHQAGRIHPQQLSGSVKVNPMPTNRMFPATAGNEREAYPGPKSRSVEDVDSAVDAMHAGAKAKRKAARKR